MALLTKVCDWWNGEHVWVDLAAVVAVEGVPNRGGGENNSNLWVSGQDAKFVVRGDAEVWVRRVNTAKHQDMERAQMFSNRMRKTE